MKPPKSRKRFVEELNRVRPSLPPEQLEAELKRREALRPKRESLDATMESIRERDPARFGSMYWEDADELLEREAMAQLGWRVS